MALSKRIRAFAGVVLFLSILPGAYLLGMWQGAGRAAGNSNDPQTGTNSIEPLGFVDPGEKLERDAQLNPNQSNPNAGIARAPVAGVVALLGANPLAAQIQADMQAMQQRMDHVFRQAQVGLAADLGGGVGLTPQEMEETDKAYIFRYLARGLEKCSLKVKLEYGHLSVSGQFSQGNGTAQSTSSFAQSQSLPGEVDPHSLKTDLENGILTITLNKR